MRLLACRQCHDLTYRSSQEAKQYTTRITQMGHDAEKVGLSAADIGLDLPEAPTVAVLREMLERG